MKLGETRILTVDDPEYPINLSRFPDSPKRLFISGKMTKNDQKAIAIVGSRKMSEFGKRIAYKFAFKLAESGVTIVSGLARGVDSVSHLAALEAHGRTIAVLGSGLDTVYPAENYGLAERISREGAVISEYPLGTKPIGRNFLARNRIIVQLSLAVLVVEGAARSGTISTANWAADMGVDVYAIAGPSDSPMSAAPNYLIENGALSVTKPEEILDCL